MTINVFTKPAARRPGELKVYSFYQHFLSIISKFGVN